VLWQEIHERTAVPFESQVPLLIVSVGGATGSEGVLPPDCAIEYVEYTMSESVLKTQASLVMFYLAE
jgi:hypothetical protein